jgi:Uma2 family endonuclease
MQWTCNLFHAAGDFGLFEGRRAMLIDGILYEEGPEPPPHCCVRGLTADIFYRAFPGCHLRQRSALVLVDNTDPVPDVMVVEGDIRACSKAHPTKAVFVVEVADFSRDVDTMKKRDLYAAAGVPDYWVIDLNSRQVLVFRDPQPDPSQTHGHGYATQLTFGPADTVSPLAVPTAAVKVADLLP